MHQGYLEWGAYSANSNVSIDTKLKDMNDNKHDINESKSYHNVLLAADVVYNSDEIPNLVLAVKAFFVNNNNYRASNMSDSVRNSTEMIGNDDKNSNSENGDALAVLATTYRNEKTFELFLSEMDKHNDIQRENISKQVVENLVHVFPCYFDQPRSDIRISILKYVPSQT